MPEKSLSIQPAGEGELICNPGKTHRIWFSFKSVEFERRYGYFHRDNVDKWFQDWPIDETRKYDDITSASLDRLHKVISKLVNDHQATIDLFQMKNGAGYEVEI